MRSGIPRLRFLRRAHECNYCRGVNGITFTQRPKVVARLLWVWCLCGRQHYICIRDCARRVGYIVKDGRRYVAACARGYFKKHRAEIEHLRASRGGSK